MLKQSRDGSIDENEQSEKCKKSDDCGKPKKRNEEKKFCWGGNEIQTTHTMTIN